MKIKNTPTIYQLYKYLFLGGLTTLVYFLLAYVFLNILGFSKFVGVSIAYLIFIVLNFNAHRRFTFLALNEKAKKQFFRYLTLVVTSYFLTLLIVYFISNILQMKAIIGVILASAITTILGFIVSRLWVYTQL